MEDERPLLAPTSSVINDDYDSEAQPSKYPVNKSQTVPHGTVASSILNLANGAIGAGVLAFPYAYRDTGLIAGFVVTVIMIGLLAFSLHVVSRVTDQFKARTYQELVGTLLGKKIQKVCEVMLVLYLVGSCIAYMTVMGDIIGPVARHWAGHHFYTTRDFLIVSFAIFVMFPLCLLKRIDVLALASVLAVLSCSYLAVFVSYEGIEELVKNGFDKVHSERLDFQFLAALPLICFAYQCQIMVPPVYSNLKNANLSKMSIITAGALTICTLLYVPVGSFGYIKFGDDTDSDILLNFDVGNVGASIARMCVAFTVTLAYPINNFPARLTIASMLFKDNDPSTKRLYLITGVTFVINLAVAILVPSITVVFSILGATLGVSMIFFYPALFAWKLQQRLNSQGKSYRAYQIGAGVLGIVGIFIASTGTYLTIASVV